MTIFVLYEKNYVRNILYDNGGIFFRGADIGATMYAKFLNLNKNGIGVANFRSTRHP